MNSSLHSDFGWKVIFFFFFLVYSQQQFRTGAQRLFWQQQPHTCHVTKHFSPSVYVQHCCHWMSPQQSRSDWFPGNVAQCVHSFNVLVGWQGLEASRVSVITWIFRLADLSVDGGHELQAPGCDGVVVSKGPLVDLCSLQAENTFRKSNNDIESL